MTIVPAQSSGFEYTGAIPLPRYAQIIGYADCAFFGVSHPGNASYQCSKIWSLAQRREIAKYLTQAQRLIEQVLGYPVQPTYITGTIQPGVPDMYTDNQRWLTPMITRWRHVIEVGVKVTDDIALATAVSHLADPATVGPIATALTDVDEIHVYLPGTDIEVIPSSIQITGGNLTIEIPRCRLVAEAYLDNPEQGLDYNVLTNFADTVDVKRIFTDPSTQALLTRQAGCGCSSAGCTGESQTACIYIELNHIGRVKVSPATYVSGAWQSVSSLCKCYDWAQLNYLAGLQTLPYDLEDAIIRLAHALMPNEPCGCLTVQNLWKRDRRIPEILTAERLNCPFGQNDGAWYAYCVAVNHASFRSTSL